MRIATVVGTHDGFIDFLVDDKQPSEAEVSSVPLARAGYEYKPAHFTSDTEKLVLVGIGNPLVAAVHTACRTHRGLELTPEMVWLSIAQGISNHLNFHTSSPPAAFIRGAKRMEVHAAFEVAELSAAVSLLPERIAAYARVAHTDFFRAGFSTSREIDETVIGLMLMTETCWMTGKLARGWIGSSGDSIEPAGTGLRRVVLRGTVDDWSAIRRRLERLTDVGMPWWRERLAPILDELVATAHGRPSLDFWEEFYVPTFGGSRFGALGWVIDFVPYLHAGQFTRPDLRNDLLESSKRESRSFGVGLGVMQGGWVELPLRVVGSTGEHASYSLFAGAGVSLTSDGLVSTATGWAICDPDPKLQLAHTLAERAGWRARAPYHNPRSFVATAVRDNYHADELAFGERTLSFAETECLEADDIEHEGKPVLNFVDDSDFEVDPIARVDDGRIVELWEELWDDGKRPIWDRAKPIWDDVARTSFVTVVRRSGWYIDRVTEPQIIATSEREFFARLFDSPDALFFDAPNFVAPESLAKILEMKAAAHRTFERQAQAYYPIQLLPGTRFEDHRPHRIRIEIRCDEPDPVVDELLTVMGAEANAACVPVCRQSFEAARQTGVVEMVNRACVLHRLERRLKNLGVEHSIETKSLDWSIWDDTFPAPYLMVRTDAKSTSKEVENALCSRLAEPLYSHPRAFRLHIRRATRQASGDHDQVWPVWIPTFGMRPEDLRALATELESEGWPFTFGVASGMLHRSGLAAADLLKGAVSSLATLFFDDAVAERHPQVLYLQMHDSKLVHRLVVFCGRLEWADFGMVLPEDVARAARVVEHPTGTLLNADVWDLGVRLRFDDGRRIVFRVSDDGAQAVFEDERIVGRRNP